MNAFLSVNFCSSLVLNVVAASTFFLFSIGVVKIILRLLDRRAFIRSHNCHPPKSTYSGHPFFLGFGFLIENARNIADRRFAEGVRERFGKYGSTHVSCVLHVPVVNTIDPENYEAFMKTHNDDYRILVGREKVVKVTLGSGIFSASGHEWTKSRMLVRQGMSKMTYDIHAYEDCANELIRRVKERQGRPFDFCEVGYDYTFELTASLFFGRLNRDNMSDEEKTIGQQALRQFAQDFRLLGKIGRKITLMVNQIPHLADMLYGRDYRSAKRRVENFADSHIAQSFERTNNKLDSKLSTSIEETRSLADALSNSTTDRLRIRRELLNLLLAAHDTNGIAITELMYCLARAPEVWSKLRKEVDEAFHGQPPQSIADLKRLTYLRHVIFEGTRLRPTLSVHGRKAIRDTVLPRGGGPDGCSPLFVPKKSYVLYSNYAMHRNPAIFSADLDTKDPSTLAADVDAFRPERWTSINPSRFEFLPFGAGPRACPGEKMGWSALAYAIVRLAQEFSVIEARDERMWEEATAFSFFNRHGVWVEIRDGQTQDGGGK